MNRLVLGLSALLIVCPTFAQTISLFDANQVVTLDAALSSLNLTQPISNVPNGPAGNGNASIGPATGGMRMNIRFVGAAPQGTTTSVSRATVVISFDSSLPGLNQPLAQAKIYKGSSGTDGVAMLDLSVATGAVVPGNNNGVNGSFEVTDTSQLQTLVDIAANPTLYYVQVATQEYPGGVLRGQFHRAGNTLTDFNRLSLDVNTLLLIRIAYAQGAITATERDQYMQLIQSLTPQ